MRNKKLLFYATCIITIASISHCADGLKRSGGFFAKIRDFFTVPKKLKIPASAPTKKNKIYMQKEFITIDLNTRRFDNEAMPQYYISQKNWHLVLDQDSIEAIKVMQKKIEEINDAILRRFLVSGSTRKISGFMQKGLTELKKSDPLYEQKVKEIEEEFKQKTEEIVNEFNSRATYETETLRVVQDAEKIHIVWDEKTNRLLNMKIPFIEYWCTILNSIKTPELSQSFDGLLFINIQDRFFHAIRYASWGGGIFRGLRDLKSHILICKNIDEKLRDIVQTDRSEELIPEDEFIFDQDDEKKSTFLVRNTNLRPFLEEQIVSMLHQLNKITGNTGTQMMDFFSKDALEKPETIYFLQCNKVANDLAVLNYIFIKDKSIEQFLEQEKNALYNNIIKFNAELKSIITAIFKPYTPDNAKRIDDWIESNQFLELDTFDDTIDDSIHDDEDLAVNENEDIENEDFAVSHLMIITASEAGIKKMHY